MEWLAPPTILTINKYTYRFISLREYDLCEYTFTMDVEGIPGVTSISIIDVGNSRNKCLASTIAYLKGCYPCAKLRLDVIKLSSRVAYRDTRIIELYGRKYICSIYRCLERDDDFMSAFPYETAEDRTLWTTTRMLTTSKHWRVDQLLHLDANPGYGFAGLIGNRVV